MQSTSEPAKPIHTEEFSDHMLRDIGILDGRNSNGYRRRRSIDGLLDDSIRKSRGR